MKFIAATVSLLLAEQCSAQTARLRNNNAYKSTSAERKLQPGTDETAVENIFDVAAGPDATPELFADPTVVAVDALSININLDLSMPAVIAVEPEPTEPAIAEPTEPVVVEPTDSTAVEPTVAILNGPEMGIDVEMSMSTPFASEPVPTVPATLPAVGTTVTDVIGVSESTLPSFEVDMSMPEGVIPTVVAVQTTGAPPTTVVDEFGGVELDMSTPMVVIPTEAQIVTTGVVASTQPAVSTVGAVASVGVVGTVPAATTTASVDTTASESVIMTTEPAEIDLGLSIPETDFSTPSTDLSIPGDFLDVVDEDMSMSTPSFIPPVEESSPTKMPTSWFNNVGSDSDRNSASSMATSCAIAFGAVVAGAQLL
ncbi:hypothetical protein ACHAWO_006828 [Cyclotella atomus]|uniref:Uncharacterized protein n=1 Tax=Cyclotella atomus TaxID=382360 RepID=A0ABD3PAG9_9STRA